MSLQFTDNQQLIRDSFSDQHCLICYGEADSPTEDDRSICDRIRCNFEDYINNPYKYKREQGVYFHKVHNKLSHPVHFKCYRTYLEIQKRTRQRPMCLGCNVPKLVPEQVISLGEKLHPLTLAFFKNTGLFCALSVFEYVNSYTLPFSIIPMVFCLSKSLNSSSKEEKVLFRVCAAEYSLLAYTIIWMSFKGHDLTGREIFNSFDTLKYRLHLMSMTGAFFNTLSYHQKIPTIGNMLPLEIDIRIHITNITNIVNKLLIFGAGLFLLSKFASSFPLNNKSFLEICSGYLLMSIVPSITHVLVSPISHIPYFLAPSNWNEKNILTLTKSACKSPLLTSFSIIKSYGDSADKSLKFVSKILVENKEEIQQKIPGCIKRSIALSVRVTTFAWNHLFRCIHAFYPIETNII